MHQSGVVTHLLRLIGSEDEDVQVCVKFVTSGMCHEHSFIRRLLLTVSRISGNWLWRVRNLDTNISSHDETKRALFRFLLELLLNLSLSLLCMLLALLFVQNKPFLMVSVAEIYHHKTYGPLSITLVVSNEMSVHYSFT